VLGRTWKGIPFLKLIEHVKPKKDWVCLMQYGLDGYTVNVAREDVEREDVFIAFESNGESLSDEHGVIRLLIPNLYGWKGCKFLGGLEFLEKEEKGFWEIRGAHNRGRVQFEERWNDVYEKNEGVNIKELLSQNRRAKSLDLSHLDLTEIPQEVFSFTNLEELRLENNKITSVPPQIAKLEKLQRLVLSQNKLTTLPVEIGKLRNLSELYLINNNIDQIPSELADCTELVSVWFDNNRLKKIPVELANLIELGALSLDNNLIEDMPKEFSNLTNLRSLSFRKNPVKRVPPEYHLIKSLQQGWLGFDSVNGIPDQIIEEDTPAILAELKRQYEEEELKSM